MRVVFTVDLFNEGVDVPTVDTLLLLRPTDSPTLFLQQLGRGLRKAAGKTVCTVLDFVGNHRQEFRFDRRFRALLGGSPQGLERQVERGFPFLPAGCHLELDPVAREIVLRSISKPSRASGSDKCDELRSLGDVSLGDYLERDGPRARGRVRRKPQLVGAASSCRAADRRRRPERAPLLAPCGRLLHVDDAERLDAYRSFVAATRRRTSHASTSASGGCCACSSARSPR